jgi:DNA mismatch repair protein MutS
MRQYLEMKGRYPDAILFFQVGDFYEMFFEDAEEASRLLNLTLTSRNNGEAARVPLAGVPIKAAQEYVQRLIRLGRRVAICQQVEDASQARGVVRREVVETVTPGAVFSEALLEAGQNNFLAAVAGSAAAEDVGLAWADISTGEFFCGGVARSQLSSELERIDAREIVFPSSWEPYRAAQAGDVSERPATYREDWNFDLEIAGEKICRHFGITSLASLGLSEPGDEPAVRAAGALRARGAARRRQPAAATPSRARWHGAAHGRDDAAQPRGDPPAAPRARWYDAVRCDRRDAHSDGHSSLAFLVVATAGRSGGYQPSTGRGRRDD